MMAAVEIIAIFQKNPTTSAVHPIGGLPGMIFRIAGNANSIDVDTI
jgi:hypothetical protein